MVECVDLREVAGRYHVTIPENGSRSLWDMSLVGSCADICPWGGDLLAICFHSRPRLAQRTLGRSWILHEQSQVGDGVEVNAVFYVHDLDKATEVAGVEKQRRQKR